MIENGKGTIEQTPRYSEIQKLLSINDTVGYLRQLSKIKDCIVIASVKDTCGNRLNLSLSEAMRAAGFITDLRGKHWHGYIGVVDCGRAVYETLGGLDGCVRYSVRLGELKFDVLSAPWRNGNNSSIIINDIDYSINLRGVNIVVFDKQKNAVFDSVCFDAHETETFTIIHKKYYTEEYELLTCRNSQYKDRVFFCKDGIRRWLTRPVKICTEHGLSMSRLRDVGEAELLSYTRGADMNEGEEHLVIPQSTFDNVNEVYIHMGSPKTATTSIQKTLHAPENFELLKSAGYLYPRTLGENHHMSMGNLFIKDAINKPWPWVVELGIQTEEQMRFFNEDTVAKLMNEIVVHQCDKLILSSEILDTIRDDGVEKIKTFFTEVLPNAHIKIIFCTRDTVAHMISMTQQVIASEGATIEGRLQNSHKWYAGYFRRFFETLLAHFKHADIIAYKFEDTVTAEFGPVGHFLSVLGYTDDVIKQFNFYKANESRCYEAAILFSYINSRIPRIVRNGNLRTVNRDSLKVHMYEPLYMYARGVKFALTQAQIDTLVKATREDARWLLENFGIDYTETSVQPINEENAWSQETLEDFQVIFPYLTLKMKEAFLDFFEIKYNETGDAKFLCLFSKDSMPRKMYELELRK